MEKEEIQRQIDLCFDAIDVSHGAITGKNLAKIHIEKLIDSINKENKQHIIDAVNYQDKKCIKTANRVIKTLDSNCEDLFVHNPEEGLNYYLSAMIFKTIS